MNCSKCGEIKGSDFFYPSNKYQCKACVNIVNKEWVKNNSVRVQKHQRTYKERHPEYKECRAKYQKEWVKKNLDKVKKLSMRRRSNPEYRKNQSEYYKKWSKGKPWKKKTKQQLDADKNWKKLNQKARRSQRIIEISLRNGIIKRPEMCEMCKEEKRILAHHEDYNYPLRITWICYSCHAIIHGAIKRGNNEQQLSC